ncbi:MAG TPA: hypothetical protein VGM60_07765 [Pseudonocardia sp.]
MADKCDCGLWLDPPVDADYYWPSLEQADADVKILTRFGEHPTYRRVERHASGWRERGSSVDGTGTPGPIPWDRVGMCWAGYEHAVVYIKKEGDE